MDSRYIMEAFSQLESLDEDVFELTDSGVEKLKELEEEPVDDEVIVFDINAKDEKDIEDTYVGKIILDCDTCHSKFYKDKDKVVIDHETKMANVGEECPICAAHSGYKIIGKVCEYTDDDCEDGNCADEHEDIEVKDHVDVMYDELDEGTKDRNSCKMKKVASDVYGSVGEEYKDAPGNKRKMLGKNSRPNSIKDDQIDHEMGAKKHESKHRVTEATKLPADDDEANELALYASNTSELYHKMIKPLIANLKRKIKRGIFDKDLAVKAFRHVADEAARMYKDEFADYDDVHYSFTPATRDIAAKIILDHFMDEINFEESLEEDFNIPQFEPGKLTQIIKDCLKELPSNKFNYEISNELTNKNRTETFCYITITNKRGNKVAYLKTYDDGYTFDKMAQKEYDYLEDAIDAVIKKNARMETENELGESIKEDFERVDIETDKEKMSMTAEEGGKVVVTTEPKTNNHRKEEDKEVIEPIDDEEKEEIERNGEDTSIEIGIDEIDEEEFDALGESYLKSVYDNVKSYKTTGAKATERGIRLEGVITFSSGNSKKTSFIFEAHSASRDKKVKFIGENKEIAKAKGSFSLFGSVKGTKLISESLTYNYRTLDNGKRKVISGSVKR